MNIEIEVNALNHLKKAEEISSTIEGISTSAKAREILTVSIIGGGTMGGGIAMNFANAGIPVTLIEINDEAIQRSLAIIEKNYSRTVAKGKLSEQQKQNNLKLIHGTTDYDEITNSDLVIEAVFENPDLKKEIFKTLDNICKPGCVLATNTSYQDIDLIAAATKRPEDVLGMHFFSPANIMKLLEVVRGKETADDVLVTAMDIAKKINKVPVLAGNCYGFIGNRMLEKYFREAYLCLIEGGTPEQIDGVMETFGMAMGPIAVGDLAGLDIGYKARQALNEIERGDPKTFCITDTLVEMGRLGQKSGAGYYTYNPETRERQNDPKVMELVIEKSTYSQRDLRA